MPKYEEPVEGDGQAASYTQAKRSGRISVVMNDRLMLAVMIIFVLVLCFVYLFTNVCHAQSWIQISPPATQKEIRDSTVWWLCRELDRVESQLSVMNASLSETREELAEMQGRQNVTTGVSAGVPTGLAGLLFWWLRRERRRKYV